MTVLPHIFLHDFAEATPYTSRSSGGDHSNFKGRDRFQHSDYVRRQLEAARVASLNRKEERTAVSFPTRQGTYLEFEGLPGFDLATQSLENRGKGIRLVNIRKAASGEEGQGERGGVRATVFIPAGQERFFLERVREYSEENTRFNKPRNLKLIESIESVRLACIESFWTDDPTLLPREDFVWCEAWLQGDGDDVESAFREHVRQLDLSTQTGSLRFPERTVVLIKANGAALFEIVERSDSLAEFRLAKETARFWSDLTAAEQTDWVEELTRRIRVEQSPRVSVCIHDAGVNNGHRLLEPILRDIDRHSYDPSWGKDDRDGHGTLMSGLACYGDIQQALESSSVITVPHCLESVKILPPEGENIPSLYGHITSQATSRVEVQAPQRTHIHCMAVTAPDRGDRGRPSSWSAAIDALSSGVSVESLAPENGRGPDVAEERRLYVISAGNTADEYVWKRYPDSNFTDPVQDPAQSWNALVVGAYTEKTLITDPELKDYVPIASAGSLSPFSTTSIIWEKQWPCKPDIVMEGGNALRAPDGFCTTCDDTSLLSLSHRPTVRQFDWINATSAATAQASWMAAQIKARYPDAWPETIRGLMVHSAEWPERMKQDFLEAENKSSYARLMRICGYGVPDLHRALNCAENSLTLIAQEEIQPFVKKEESSEYKTNEMHIFELPWPREVLEELADTKLKVRITLSYFVEPSPGQIGWKDRYKYPSHTLRFDLNSATENREQFLARINAAAREEGEAAETASGSERWTIGSTARSRGSIHSDIWCGSAADLAACNLIGVYPIGGWWQKRYWLNCGKKMARYSLIVSLYGPDIDVDIYTPVAIKAGVTVPVSVAV